MANRPELQFLTAKDGETIAYRVREGKTRERPGLFSLTGFKSKMDGDKVVEVDRFAKTRGLAACRFDYFGHGASSGDFEKGTISRWMEDTLQVFDEVAKGPQIVIGSSMGGWLALLLARARPERVKGLVLIAPSPDFTKIMRAALPDEARALLDAGEPWPRASDYDDEPYMITAGLLDDGDKHLLLDGASDLEVPVRILQGMKDKDVPFERSLQLIDWLGGDDVTLKLLKNGDHRLSDEAGLLALNEALKDLLTATA